MISLVKSHLSLLVRVAFMESGRSVAHLATKLITLCLEHSKVHHDVTLYQR